MLQQRKSSLQVDLLRRFKGDVYLKYATDNTDESEVLYSVRLSVPIPLGASIRDDAEHLPARIAEELLTTDELLSFLKG